MEFEIIFFGLNDYEIEEFIKNFKKLIDINEIKEGDNNEKI